MKLSSGNTSDKVSSNFMRVRTGPSAKDSSDVVMPAGPLAKLSSLNAMAAAVVVLLAVIAFSAIMFKPHFENPKVTLAEEPLAKNAEFQLRPGEHYIYAYLINGSQLNTTYQILNGNNCTIIALMEAQPPSTSCVDRWGMDKRGYNSLLENPQMMLFKPWMLALREGWIWNTSMYMAFENESQYVAGMDYRVMRTDTWRGRKAFVVVENISGSAPQYEWVDAEKRILLRVQGEGYEAVLVEGLPFSEGSGNNTINN